MLTDLNLIEDLLVGSDNRESYFHGERHWRAVAQAGWYIAASDPRINLDVVLLFSVLHDTRRENENHDPEHGERAALRAWGLRGLERLNTKQAGDLYEALYIHNGGAVSSHATPFSQANIGACLDADRLNLWRVGKEPNPKFLSTPYARKPEVIRWAKRLHQAPLTWSQLVQAYAALEAVRGSVRSFGTTATSATGVAV